jgi:hypothetical protein
MSPSIEEGISNTGIQGHILQRMSTQTNLRDGETSPIYQAEMLRQARNHHKINWLLAKFPLDGGTANITSVLELIAVAIKLHHLRAIIVCLNTTTSAKMHPVEHSICHLEDLEEWHSGGTTVENTRHTGGGVEKETCIIVIHKELDPITVATATKEDHPSAAIILEGLHTWPNIIHNYDCPRATE